MCVRVLFSSRRCFRQNALARTAPLLEHRVPYEGSVEAAIRVFPKGMPNNGLLRTLTKVSLLSPSERRLILTRLSPTRREWRVGANSRFHKIAKASTLDQIPPRGP